MTHILQCGSTKVHIFTYPTPSIFPRESVDTMYVSLLNYSQVPLVSPLQKSTNIEMYNDIYFQLSKVSINRPSKYEASNQVDS